MSKHERQEAKRERRAAARQAEPLTGGELFSGALEAEHASDVFLVHQGMRHEELNLEGPAIIGESLQKNLSRAKGKRIVVLENAGGTKEQVDQLHETIDKIGFQGIVVLELIGAETQKAVSPSQIKERIKQIAYTKKVSDVLRQRLLPVSDVWRFYMGRELDKARSRWPFEVVHEYHTPDFNEKEKIAGESGNVSEQVRALWENGEFDQALGLYIPGHQKTMASAALRDPDIIQLGVSKVEQLKKDKNTGMVYMLFGESHSRNARVIAQATMGNPDAAEILGDVSVDTPNGQIEELVENGLEVPDVLYARDLFIHRAMEATINAHLRGRGDFDYFITWYESHRRAIEQHASTLSLEQLREICETKQEFAFVQNQ